MITMAMMKYTMFCEITSMSTVSFLFGFEAFPDKGTDLPGQAVHPTTVQFRLSIQPRSANFVSRSFGIRDLVLQRLRQVLDPVDEQINEIPGSYAQCDLHIGRPFPVIVEISHSFPHRNTAGEIDIHG